MVLQPQVLAKALRSLQTDSPPHTIYLTPSGAPLTAARARALSQMEHLVLVCGHYEGIDQRAIDALIDEEISIGDYVLTNGCPAALVLADVVARFLPGILGHADSARFDSYEGGFLEWPQFTRPAVFEKKSVPRILLEGDHGAIAKWRESQALEKTQRVRPDLLRGQKQCFEEQPRLQPPKKAVFRQDSAEQENIPPTLTRLLVVDVQVCAHWYGVRWPFDWTWLSSTVGRAHFPDFCVIFEQSALSAERLPGLPKMTLEVALSLDLGVKVHAHAQLEGASVEVILLSKSADIGELDPQESRIIACDPNGINWIWNCAHRAPKGHNYDE